MSSLPVVQQQQIATRPAIAPAPPTPPPITITWIGSPNFAPGRPAPPKAIIIHTMGGSLAGTDSWFQNPAAQVSTHYGVGLDGRVSQYVHLDDTAWGNGVLEPGNTWPYHGNPNGITVSIETEDLGNPNQPVTDAEFDAVLAVCQVALAECPTIELLSTHAIISPQSRPNCAGHRWVESGRLAQLAGLLHLPLLAPGVAATAPENAVSSRQQVIDTITRVADDAGVPRVALLALCVAESNLDPRARRPKNPADDARYWGDVSMGLAQQTVRWSAEYGEWCGKHGHDPAVFPGPDVIETIGDLYYDPEHAARVAAAQLRFYLEREGGVILPALSAYNKPNVDPADNPNLGNYVNGLKEAKRILYS